MSNPFMGLQGLSSAERDLRTSQATQWLAVEQEIRAHEENLMRRRVQEHPEKYP